MTIHRRIRSATVPVLLGFVLAGGMTLPGVHAAGTGASTHKGTASLKLVNAGYLTVGTDASYPPMESGTVGHYFGADIDLARALAKAMGLKGARIINNAFDTIIPAMAVRHKFDVIMSSMSDTPLRRQTISFVDYMRANEGILVRSSSTVHANSYSGLCGMTVSVQSGTTELDGLHAANAKCAKKIGIKVFTQDTAAYQALVSRHADAYTSDLPVVALYVKDGHGAFRLAGKSFGAGGDYGIGLQKNNPGLKVALTRAVSKIRANGQYRRILNKWGVNGASL